MILSLEHGYSNTTHSINYSIHDKFLTNRISIDIFAPNKSKLFKHEKANYLIGNVDGYGFLHKCTNDQR